ncbi:MAG TPA: alkaline shock response membrane anchor protein AmaP [Firmicutes bacterium]|nr:alkaline shock response membrane anchor protein AmaP [Bacillota bacterium]
MGIGDRFLLFLAAMLLAVIALGVILLGLNLPVAQNLATQFVGELVYGQWVAVLIGAAVLAIGLRLAVLSLAGRKPPGALISRSELGEVSITVPAVENMVQRTATQVDGVKEVRPSVAAKSEGVAVKLKTWVEKDVNVPELAAQVQEILGSHLKEVAGLAVASINVEVQGVGSEPTFKTRSTL